MPGGPVARAIARRRHAKPAGAGSSDDREQLRRLVNEQAAVRRVAVLVARGAPPPQIFAAVADEMGSLLAADYITITRHEPDDTVTVVGSWSRAGMPGLMPPLGGSWAIEPGTPEEELVRTGKPVRSTGSPPAETMIGEWARARGIKHLLLCPITVDGQLWGLAANVSPEPQPEGTLTRMLEFTELIGIAIANAHGRAELIASRARVVAAADAARRRIERDLHDGAQQRLVSLCLAARVAETTVPPGQEELRRQLDGMARGLSDVVDDLREIAHGLLPAVLSRSGLHAALRSVARRLAIPVDLDVRIDAPLDEPVETAVYYVVSEALANTLKHARAAKVHVSVHTDDDAVHVSIRDDGVGGADLGGSGCTGIRDRVEALGGRIRMHSPAGEGTLLQIEIPLQSGE